MLFMQPPRSALQAVRKVWVRRSLCWHNDKRREIHVPRLSTYCAAD